MIVIIDYGVGNLRSVQKAFKRNNFEVIISNDIKEIKKASKLILPGVGHFKHAMNSLKRSGLLEDLNTLVLEVKTPILGICLGMQLMTKYSEEGQTSGLGWVNATTRKFQVDYKVPHIGWSSSENIVENKFTKGINVFDEFYFVHSYYVETHDKSLNIIETKYQHKFTSGFRKNNIYGVQFHPEKSYSKGIQLLRNFAEL